MEILRTKTLLHMAGGIGDLPLFLENKHGTFVNNRCYISIDVFRYQIY